MHINKIELRVQNEEVLLRLISMFGVSVGGTTFISFKTIHCYFDLENDFFTRNRISTCSASACTQLNDNRKNYKFRL